ncbi:hypothetical protein PG996_013927 [Apiospora saccharicola]|uniref:Zn(2)-C6 fungal-type domain-containing protein n=1 Tax=Apiospora saccharicola TaxID=335842 RepID=A0ABR1TGV4_9PEZI
MESLETEPSRKRGRYAFLKCDQCRKDKQKQQAEKCDRCEAKGFECSDSRTAVDAKQTTAESSPDEFTFQVRLGNFLSAWQWYRKLVQLLLALEPSKREKLKVMTIKFSEKLSQELTCLYQIARDSRDVAAKALLGHLCCDDGLNVAARLNYGYTFCAYTRSEDIGDVQEIATSAISNAIQNPTELSTPTWTKILEFVEIKWDSGDTENCLETLRDNINGHLLNWSDPDDEEWNDLILLTEKFIDYSEQSRQTNSQLFKDNYLNMADHIPELKATINMRQHLKRALMDNNTKYLEWLVRSNSGYMEVVDAKGDTLRHLACSLTVRRAVISGEAVRLLVNSDPYLTINRQNFAGETALHCLCASIGRSRQTEKDTLTSYLITLRRLLSYRYIDINIRDFSGRHGNGRVASWYLVQEWYLSPKHRVYLAPFLQSFKGLHPRHTLISALGTWSGV